MGVINQRSTPTGKTATVENRTIDAIVEDIKELNEVVKTIVPYKSLYWALLTQSNEDDPSANVLHNDTGLSVVYTRVSDGVYDVTIPGYDPEKMVVEIPNFAAGGFISYTRNGLGEGVKIYTYKITEMPTNTPSDDWLENTPIKIYIFD